MIIQTVTGKPVFNTQAWKAAPLPGILPAPMPFLFNHEFHGICSQSGWQIKAFRINIQYR